MSNHSDLVARNLGSTVTVKHGKKWAVNNYRRCLMTSRDESKMDTARKTALAAGCTAKECDTIAKAVLSA